MNKNYFKEEVNSKSKSKHLKQLFLRGYKKIKENKEYQIACSFVIILEIILLVKVYIHKDPNQIIELANSLKRIIMTPLFILIDFLFVLLIGNPMILRKDERSMIRGGLNNGIGEPPLLLSREKMKLDGYGKCEKFIYISDGIPISEWMKRKEYIESSLNKNIIDIRQGDEKNIIEVITASGKSKISEYLEWDDAYTKTNDAEYILGMSLSDRLISYNVDITPMVLICSATGGGKTNLVKTQIRQAILRNTEVILIDKKMGIDYGSYYRKNCTLLTEDCQINDVLKELVREMKRRFQLISGYDNANNISELRDNYGIEMTRILVVIDELAQITDHTGASKDRKQLLDEIELSLSQLSALARAVGINLILSTQRPDQYVIPGIVRSNINVRVCGRADENLSRVVFGDGRANDEIPKGIRGRFMLGDENHTQFQSFYIKD